MMKKLLFTFLLLFSLSSFAQEEFPKLTEIVTDNANIFSPSELQRLKNKLTNFETETTNQVVVLTVKNLDGYTIERFANLTFNQNKLGQKGYDNGLLIVFSDFDREVRIEVGSGLEPYITDALSSRIIRNTMIPEFKNENYFTGINLATDEVIHYLENPEAIKEFEASLEEEKQRDKRIATIFTIVFLSIFVLAGLGFFIAMYKNLLKVCDEILTGKLGVLEGGFVSCFLGFFTTLPLMFVILPIVFGLSFLGYEYDFDESKWLANPLWVFVLLLSFLLLTFIIAFIRIKVVGKKKVKLVLTAITKKSFKGFTSGGSGSSSRSYSSSSGRSSSSSSSFSGGCGSSGGGGSSGSW